MADSVTGAGLLAIQRGQHTAATASNRIARAGTTADSDPTADITRGAVELMESEHLVKAGAKVIKTADQMLGSLFDEKA
jgi:flagellar hook protein FlgE